MSHPTRGSCVDPSCEFHGVCHDGCGDLTWVAAYNEPDRGYVKGQPSMWKSGHGYWDRHVFTPEERARSLAEAHRADVPVERVEKLAFWLVERCGGYKQAAAAADLNWQTFYEIVMPRRRRRKVTPRTALGISRAVLELRQADRALPPLDYEVVDLRGGDQVVTGPLREALERYLSSEGVPIRQMQQWYADRFGAEFRTGTRHWRIVFHEDTVPLAVADRWCALIGIPFDYVYAEEAS